MTWCGRVGELRDERPTILLLLPESLKVSLWEYESLLLRKSLSLDTHIVSLSLTFPGSYLPYFFQ